MYERKLASAEVRARIERCWQPYHEALAELLDAHHEAFGAVWHINCHSMPAVGDANADDPGAQRDQTKARQSQVQGQLNLAVASDATVEAQLKQLTAAVTAQQNLVDDARNAQAAADAAVRTATRQLADVGSRLDQTRRQLRNVAIRAYMQPTPPVTSGGGLDINELVYSQEFLSVAALNQVEVIDA